VSAHTSTRTPHRTEPASSFRADVFRNRSLNARVEASAARPALPELTPRNRAEGSDRLVDQLRELCEHRELLYTITRREVKVRYTQTVLGALWAVFQPLSLMLVLTLLLAFLAPPSTEGPYPLFSYTGLLPWTFFTTAVTFATPSLVAHSHIITRIYFPREIVPLACVLAALVDFGIAASVLVVMLAIYGIPPTLHALTLIPLLVIQIGFTAGLCLLLSSTTVIYRDVRFTVPLLLQLWMFATPIIYPLSSVPERIRELYLALNPMAVVVDGYRRALILGQPAEPRYLVAAGLITGLLLWGSYAWFKRQEKHFADLA
jgi:lipopolysaccharide transport system permease protein